MRKHVDHASNLQINPISHSIQETSHWKFAFTLSFYYILQWPKITCYFMYTTYTKFLIMMEQWKWWFKSFHSTLCWLPWSHLILIIIIVATPLWPSVGVKPNTSKVGDLESSGTPECLEFDSKAQETSYWGVLDVIGKVLKRRYRKWPRIGHLNICSSSYGQKKGRESNWQFDSRPLKVGNRPLLDIRFESATRRWKELDEGYNFGSDLVAIRLFSRELWAPKVPGLQPGQFRDSNLGVPGKRATSM
jgi:hypothetical protein